MNRKRSDNPLFLLMGGSAASVVNFRLPLLRAVQSLGFLVGASAPGIRESAGVRQKLAEERISAYEVAIDRTGISPLKDLRSILSSYLLFRRLRPKHVLTYTAKPVIFGTIGAWLARVPHRHVLITGLGYAFIDDEDRKRYLVRLVMIALYRIALARATSVTFQNRDDAELFRSLGLVQKTSKIAIVGGSGVDLDYFQSRPLPSGPTTFTLIARMLASKGVREFATAARIVKDRFPEARFNLVGALDSNPDGISRSELEGWQSAGILNWLGFQEDVRVAIEKAHVIVLPSYYREGTPRSSLEAMAMARPLITTDVPGCRDTVIDGRNGCIVPPRDAKALAKAMTRFIKTPTLSERYGVVSRLMAGERYEVGKVNAAMILVMGLTAEHVNLSTNAAC